MMMYFHRRLPHDEFRNIEEHIDKCQACRGIVAELARNASGSDLQVTKAHTDSKSDAQTISSEMLSRGMLVDRFVILARLGAGGMGVVFAAYDPKLERKIALKFLRVSYQREVRELQTARLLREAKVMARLSHPNVVAIYELGLWNNQVFVAMEFVQGRTIKEWIQTEGPCRKKILEVFLQAGRGLEAVHMVGLVHRDFKPDNVMISQDGRVLVTDFGLARDAIASAELGEASAPPMEAASLMSSVAAANSSDPMTRTGEFLGTPAYMAPEQFLHQPVDSQTDQFAYCVTLYEALYGQRPFSGDTIKEISQQIVDGEVRRPPNRVKGALWLFRILQRGLARDPPKRFASMTELLGELSQDPMKMQRRVWAIGGLCLLLGLVSFVTYWLLRPDRRVCEAQEEFQGIWNPQRAEQVKAEFMKTELPYAQAAWGQVDQRLNQLLQSWERMRREICEATWIRHEQSEQLLDLRMQCLNRRKEEIRAFIDLLVKTDSAMMDRSVEALAALSDISNCSNMSALSAPVELPNDPRIRAKVSDMNQRLASLKALYISGKFKEGLTQAEELVKILPALVYPPSEAESRYWLGVFQYRTGDPHAAEQSLLQAANAGVARRYGEFVVRSWSLLSSVVGVDLARQTEGTRWADMALAWIDGMGGNPVLEADVRKNLSKVFYNDGKYEMALAALQHAHQLQINALGSSHLETILTENGIGLQLHGVGKDEEALKTLSHAASVMAQEVGSEHPFYANILHNMAIVHNQQGNFEKALLLSQQALDIYRKAMAPESRVIGNALNIVGIGLVNLHRFAEAETYFKEALTIHQKVEGPNSKRVATSNLNLGVLYSFQGRLQEALAVAQKASSIFENSYPKGYPDLAKTYVVIGDVYQKTGNFRLAISFYQKGQEMLTKLLGANHPWVADAVLGLGEVYQKLGQHAKAASAFETILSKWKPSEVGPETYASVQFGLAKSMWILPQNRAKCRTLIQDAHRQLFDRGALEQKQLQEIERWMSDHGILVPTAPNKDR